jgi:hypothetical protein
VHSTDALGCSHSLVNFEDSVFSALPLAAVCSLILLFASVPEVPGLAAGHGWFKDRGRSQTFTAELREQMALKRDEADSTSYFEKVTQKTASHLGKPNSHEGEKPE